MISVYAIGGSVVLVVKNAWSVAELFRYYTLNANSFTAFTACMIIPFAVEGIRRKSFKYPKWLALIFYSGAVCTTVTMCIVLPVTLSVSFAIRWLYNRLAGRRADRFLKNLWPEGTNMTEIRIELFGLGRYMGKHSDTDQVEVPFEMIRRIASRYGLDTEKLVRPFIKGMMDSIAEKRPPD